MDTFAKERLVFSGLTEYDFYRNTGDNILMFRKLVPDSAQSKITNLSEGFINYKHRSSFANYLQFKERFEDLGKSIAGIHKGHDYFNRYVNLLNKLDKFYKNFNLLKESAQRLYAVALKTKLEAENFNFDVQALIDYTPSQIELKLSIDESFDDFYKAAEQIVNSDKSYDDLLKYAVDNYKSQVAFLNVVKRYLIERGLVSEDFYASFREMTEYFKEAISAYELELLIESSNS